MRTLSRKRKTADLILNEIPSMKRIAIGFTFLLALTFLAIPLSGQDKKKKEDSPKSLKKKGPEPIVGEDAYYKLLTFTTPPGEVLEMGGIEVMPDGKVALGTR